MSAKVPLIGFDRFVAFDWCQSSLAAAAGHDSIDSLRNQIALTLPGVESQRKTLDILKRLSVRPFDHVAEFILRGVTVYKRLGASVSLPITWGASMVSYPFFGKTVTTLGRLLALQGDCSIKELQRRVSEQYGDRNGIERAANRVLQSLENWQVLLRDETSKRIVKDDATQVDDVELVGWLVEAAVRSADKQLSVSSLQSMPVLFPFRLNVPVSYAISNNTKLRLWSEGPSEQFVGLAKVGYEDS